MTIFAGLLLTAFGAGGAWLLGAHVPSAKFLRAGYVMMAAGGLGFIAWSLTHALVAGILAVVLLAAGGLTGIAGALRKELRALR
ncbi:MAG: hypothetical protein JO199_02510 [Candidatus Eremiobacteraeota bacterium]|nr:hypothetical protein [Candidatus Eremiobacteraeota bacterium]